MRPFRLSPNPLSDITSNDSQTARQDEKAEDNGVKAEGVTMNASLKGSADFSHSSNLTTAKADERFAPYANNIFKEQGKRAFRMVPSIDS